MKQVTALKSELKVALADNRKKHEADFEVAHLIWRDDEIDRLEAQIKETTKYHKEQIKGLKARIETLKDDEASKSSGGYGEPDNHLRDYDAAIKMLEMSVDSELEIDNSTFQNLVMDRWDWSEDFQAVTMSYMSGPKGPSRAEGRQGPAGIRSNLNHLKG